MIAKIVLLLSITLNTFGLSGPALNLDKSLITDKAGDEKVASASLDPGLLLPEIAPYPRVKANAMKPNIYAKNFILVDSDSGVILQSKDINAQVPIASTTKIMTAIVVLENYTLDDIVTISYDAAYQIGATANFRVGEKLTVLNMLKALLVKSANGAADALAEHMNKVGETGTEKFVAKMNDKARELGLKNTEYHDPAGLDDTGWSSAYDLYLATKYALKNETFAEIVRIKKTSVTDVTGQIWHTFENSNRLVNEWDYPGAIGVKTGYMPEAGHCLVAAAQRDGHTLISVVLKTNADTPTASAEENRKLLDWGFNNVQWN